jgi:hypothetical protein
MGNTLSRLEECLRMGGVHLVNTVFVLIVIF